MADRILVPMDGSTPSKEALAYAFSEFPDADVTVINVINPLEAGYTADPMGGDYWEGWYDNAEEAADEVFEESAEIAADHDREITTVRESGRPAHTIVRYVDENDVDLVVMGSHGRSGVSRILLGSVAETVVRRSPVPVTVVR